MGVRNEKIVNYLTDLDFDDKVSLHNAFCYEANYHEDFIHKMDEIDEIAKQIGIEEFIRACRYGNVDFGNDLFHFNGYCNIETFNYASLEDYIDYEAIADYCIQNDDDLNDDVIEAILVRG